MDWSYSEETRLHYNRFRYYDPSIGRYISADPIGQLGGVNVYRYAGNDPLNTPDPHGLILGPVLAFLSTPAGQATLAAIGAGVGTALCVASGLCDQLGGAVGDALDSAAAAAAAGAQTCMNAMSGEGDDPQGALDDALADLEAGGVVDDSGNVRNVDKNGGDQSASDAFDELAGALGAEPRSSQDGESIVIDLPGGGSASLYPESESTGGPTIQVNRPGQNPTKVRFPRF